MIRTTLAQLRFLAKKPRIAPRVIKDLFMVRVLNKPRLRTIDCAVTFNCNSFCQMCSAKELMRQNAGRQVLSVREIVNVAAQAKDLGAIHFQLTGGEPTMRNTWDIAAIIRNVSRLNFLVSMVTNSIKMTEDDLGIYASLGLDTLQLSLESMDEMTHDQIRGVKGNWQKLMDVLGWALKLNLNICLSCVIANDNFEEVKRIIAFSKKLGVFTLLNPISHDESRSIRNMKKEYYDLFRNSHVRADTVVNWRGGAGCPAGIERIYITPFGDCYTCPHVPISLGNVRSESLEYIYRGICADPELAYFSPDCRWAFPKEEK